MLYEIALPVLLIEGSLRWLRGLGNGPAIGPAFKLRAARSRLRRRELDWLAKVAPTLAAELLLDRFQANRAPDVVSQPVQAVVETRSIENGLFLRWSGPETGIKLLLLHGWNTDGTMMQPLAQVLARAGFRVLVPDLPGTGASAGKPGNFVRTACQLALACAGLGPFDAIIGHSAGGLIAAIAAGYGLQSPQLVTICAPASMAHLLAMYMERTDAPKSLHLPVLARYQVRSGRAPQAIGPEDYAAFQGRHLVVHARSDWQVRPEEASLICATRAEHDLLLLSSCNHRSVLQHPDLHSAILKCLASGAGTGVAPC